MKELYIFDLREGYKATRMFVFLGSGQVHWNFTTVQGKRRTHEGFFPYYALYVVPLPYPLAPNIHCSIARLRGSVPRVVRVILSHYLAFYVNWKDIVAKKKIIVRINIKNNSS